MKKTLLVISIGLIFGCTKEAQPKPEQPKVDALIRIKAVEIDKVTTSEIQVIKNY
jgi:hypothetical protein